MTEFILYMTYSVVVIAIAFAVISYLESGD